MSIDKILKVSFPGKLVFGNGVLQQLTEEVVEQGYRNVIIMTIKPLLGQLSGFIERLQGSNIDLVVDTSIEQEPSFSDVKQLLTKLASCPADAVIGIGGGSVLDVAKLVAAQLDNTQSLDDIVGNGILKGRNKALICVPTTSGTGSEVSPNAILVDDEIKKRVSSALIWCLIKYTWTPCLRSAYLLP